LSLLGRDRVSSTGRLPRPLLCQRFANEPLRTERHAQSGTSRRTGDLQANRHDPSPAVTARNGPSRTLNPRVAGSSPARLILYGPVLRGFLVSPSRDRGAPGSGPARKFTECTRRSWSWLVAAVGRGSWSRHAADTGALRPNHVDWVVPASAMLGGANPYEAGVIRQSRPV
jgi:hypothetical protein